MPFFDGGVGNANWAGTSLAALLEEAGVQEPGIEVVFWGADAGEQTWREATIIEQFARSMSLEDATSPENLLVYEMNGEELPPLHGFPLRLIAPGWYGIADVKWLTRIEVRDSRYQGNFMARDYVTIREEERDGETVWTFTSVGRARLKSADLASHSPLTARAPAPRRSIPRPTRSSAPGLPAALPVTSTSLTGGRTGT